MQPAAESLNERDRLQKGECYGPKRILPGQNLHRYRRQLRHWVCTERGAFKERSNGLHGRTQPREGCESCGAAVRVRGAGTDPCRGRDEAGAELSQPILYPQGGEIKSVWTGSGTVTWIKQRPEQNPFQFHIINALAELPILDMASALLTKGIGFLKPSQGRVLE